MSDNQLGRNGPGGSALSHAGPGPDHPGAKAQAQPLLTATGQAALPGRCASISVPTSCIRFKNSRAGGTMSRRTATGWPAVTSGCRCEEQKELATGRLLFSYPLLFPSSRKSLKLPGHLESKIEAAIERGLRAPNRLLFARIVQLPFTPLRVPVLRRTLQQSFSPPKLL
jgi:hypothetical protein